MDYVRIHRAVNSVVSSSSQLYPPFNVFQKKLQSDYSSSQNVLIDCPVLCFFKAGYSMDLLSISLALMPSESPLVSSCCDGFILS